ncbi:glycoside hydrolase family 16 protein [Haloarchaeobius sp. DFWS5]|uniref:glycoside hydrolase family 16 protein n=1 Tax=Haloarchaeobius sp. DFWS5 TaxID=3446114 RepID=UPI003EBEA289
MTDDHTRDDVDDNPGGRIDRRDYLKLASIGALTAGGIGLSSFAGANVTAGPPNPDNWTLDFEDTFDSGSLDTSKWEVGYGWGLTDRNSAGEVSPDEVNVENGRLRLSMRYDGDITTSAVNTKDIHYYGPGSYWEASIKLPGRTGILPAFWSKPNTEDWPPEIDFVEIFQNDGGKEDTHRAEYHIHYSTSTEPDDSSTHESLDVEYDSPDDLTNSFHVYGCRWLDDRVDFYFDDIHVGTISDSTAMEALRNGGPHYMMLTNMIDKVGETDKSEHWSEEMLVDWVRVWVAGSDVPTDPPDEPDEPDEPEEPEEPQEHYFWVRADGDEPVTYAFESSDGKIRIDDGELSDGESDEWIASDGLTAGGVEDNSGGDGFWYYGDITDFAHDAPVDTYIDDEYVDPESLVDPDNPGPEKPGDDPDEPNDPSLPHTIRFAGIGPFARYSVTVSDEIVATDSVDDADEISGSTARGWVTGGDDVFQFSGEVVDLEIDDDMEIYVDGDRVDLFTIERESGNKHVDYIVETTARVLKADVPFASINSNDRIRGSKISGQVVGGVDAYWLFDGEVVDVSTFGGEVRTELNGTTHDYTD